MATELHVRAAGAFRKAKEVHVRSGGAWRKAKEVWVRSGGVWRQVFSGATVALTNRTHAVDDYEITGSAVATAGINFKPDGSLELFSLGSPSGGNPSVTTPVAGQWLEVGNPTDYELVVTLSSGTFSSGAAGTFALGGVNRYFDVTISRAAVGVSSKTCTATFVIRPLGGGAALATATITLTATAERDS